VLYKFSVDLAEEALRAALGWQPRLDVKIRPGYVATTYLKGRPGVLISCPSVAVTWSLMCASRAIEPA